MQAGRPGEDAIIERLTALYERRAPDRIFARFPLPSPRTLAAFERDHPAGVCVYPDPRSRLAFWDSLFRERPKVEDDSFPVAYLSEMDQGLYTAVLGGDIRFTSDPATGWISSMVPPLLQDLSELERLSFTQDHPWFRRYLEQLGIFQRGAEGRFGVGTFIPINGLNFVSELVGATEAYLGLYEHPGQVRRAMELGFQVNTAVQDAFFETVPLFGGGTLSYTCVWIPGRIVMESVDPFHMTSVECFETWGRGPVERLFARYDGGEIHLHGNGRHLLEATSTLAGLKAIYLGDDLGWPPAIEVIQDLRRRAPEVPFVTSARYDVFARMLEEHRLAGGVLYTVTGAPDADHARRTMDAVRDYRI